MEARQEQLEREYLALVLDKMRLELARFRDLRVKSEEDQEELHRRMWEEMPHLVRSLDDAISLYASSKEVQTEARLIARIVAEIHDLESMLISPYFGRIDFTDAGDGEEIQVYIGKRAFADREAMEFYVYDWRSPAAAMFYDFDTGPASYQSPAGERSGQITLKRQYRIRDGELTAMFDADALVVEDDILNSILMESSGRQLKVIAASIQKEQNKAIRFIEPRNVLIAGPAGSGKTSVGLHRLAYLLYHNRGRLRSQEILVISANEAFNAYIANILPDLYEEDVRRTVFDDLIKPHLPNDFQIGERFSQMEYLLHAAAEDERVQWIRMVYSPDFLSFIREYIDGLPIAYSDVRVHKHAILSKAEMRGHVEGVEGKQSFADRLLRADRLIEQECEEWFLRNDALMRDEALDSDMDLYTEQEMVDYLLSLMNQCIARHKSRIREGADLTVLSQLPKAVYAYLQARGHDSRLGDALKRRLASKRLLYEDALALLMVRAAMGQLEPVEGIRHVLIDEAQDYGAPQHALMQALFPRAVFTLLADTRQAVLEPISLKEEGELDALYRVAPRRFLLDRSYRSTGPINALAAKLLGPQRPIQYYDRPGPEPEIRIVEDLADGVIMCVSQWDDEDSSGGAATTAILTPTNKDGKTLHARLCAKGFAAELVETGEDLPEGVLVLPMLLAKGLEFDRVIVAGFDLPNNGLINRQNALYLLCTRALHRLCILAEGGVPEELRVIK